MCDDELSKIEPIDLDPRYSTGELPGRCLKCLAEEELNKCFAGFLRGELDDDELTRRFGMLITFLKSPDSWKLRAESERYLSEGKEVTVRIYFVDGEPKYELKIKE